MNFDKKKKKKKKKKMNFGIYNKFLLSLVKQNIKFMNKFLWLCIFIVI